jgi:hypothetical protein
VAGYLVLGRHPGFFLRAISRRVIEQYSHQPGGWPGIDTNGPLFTDIAINRRAYAQAKEGLKALPPGVGDLFRELFAAGLEGERRPTATEWASALAGLRSPPTVELLDVSERLVIEGSAVTVAWRASNATHVEIDSLGTHHASGSLTAIVEQTQLFSLRAVGPYGETVATSPVVRVTPLPRLEWIPIPEFPGLELKASLSMPLVASFGEKPSAMAPSLEGFFATDPDSPTICAPLIPRPPSLSEIFSDEVVPVWPSAGSARVFPYERWRP